MNDGLVIFLGTVGGLVGSAWIIDQLIDAFWPVRATTDAEAEATHA
jgi:hypothetical protein